MRPLLLVALLLISSSPAAAVWWEWVGDLNAGGANCMLADPAHERLFIGGEGGYRVYYPLTDEWLVRENALPRTVFSLLAHPSDPLFLLTGYRGPWWEGWIEDDYGLATEGPIVLGGSIGAVGDLVRLPGQPELLFACAADHEGDPAGVYRSTDGGQSWALAHDFTPSDPLALAVAANGDLLVGLRRPHGIARGIGAGQSWIDITGDMPDDNDLIDQILVDPADPQHIYAVQSPDFPPDGFEFFIGIYETRNGGAHWERIFDGEVYDLCMDPADSAVLVVVFSGGVALTRNGGGTWVDIEYNLPDGRACAISPTDDRIYVATHGSGLWATDASPTAVATAPAAGLALSAWPNPCRPQTTLHFSLREPGAVALDVFDAQGRRVRSLLTGEALPAGPQAIAWDGRDDAGRALPAGVYLVRVTTPAGEGTTRLVRLR